MTKRISIMVLKAVVCFSRNKETGNYFPSSEKSPKCAEYMTALMHINFPQGLKTDSHVSALVHLFKIKIEDIRNGLDIPVSYKYRVNGKSEFPSKIIEIYLEKTSTEELLSEII